MDEKALYKGEGVGTGDWGKWGHYTQVSERIFGFLYGRFDFGHFVLLLVRYRVLELEEWECGTVLRKRTPISHFATLGRKVGTRELLLLLILDLKV